MEGGPVFRSLPAAVDGATIPAMNSKTSARLMVVASMVYGITVGLLGALDSGATTVFAVVGACVLGLLWVIRGLFASREPEA
jgi:hypothetical protein